MKDLYSLPNSISPAMKDDVSTWQNPNVESIGALKNVISGLLSLILQFHIIQPAILSEEATLALLYSTKVRLSDIITWILYLSPP